MIQLPVFDYKNPDSIIKVIFNSGSKDKNYRANTIKALAIDVLNKKMSFDDKPLESLEKIRQGLTAKIEKEALTEEEQINLFDVFENLNIRINKFKAAIKGDSKEKDEKISKVTVKNENINQEDIDAFIKLVGKENLLKEALVKINDHFPNQTTRFTFNDQDGKPYSLNVINFTSDQISFERRKDGRAILLKNGVPIPKKDGSPHFYTCTSCHVFVLKDENNRLFVCDIDFGKDKGYNVMEIAPNLQSTNQPFFNFITQTKLAFKKSEQEIKIAASQNQSDKKEQVDKKSQQDKNIAPQDFPTLLKTLKEGNDRIPSIAKILGISNEEVMNNIKDFTIEMSEKSYVVKYVDKNDYGKDTQNNNQKFFDPETDVTQTIFELDKQKLKVLEKSIDLTKFKDPVDLLQIENQLIKELIQNNDLEKLNIYENHIELITTTNSTLCKIEKWGKIWEFEVNSQGKLIGLDLEILAKAKKDWQVKHPDEISIFLRIDISPIRIQIDVDKHLSVQSLKEKIFKLKKIIAKPHETRLIFAGKELEENEQMLSNCRVGAESKIFLCRRSKKPLRIHLLQG